MVKLLITSIGGSPALGIVRSLRKTNIDLEIYGTDANPYTIVRSEADKNYLVPFGNDQSYLSHMQFLINKIKPDLLHCQNSSEIVYVSKYRNDLNVNLFIPKHESIIICTNKYESYLQWQKNSIPTPKTILLESNEDVYEAFDKLGKEIWIRAIKGSAGKGSLPTSNPTESIHWIEKNNGWGMFTAAERLTDLSVTWMSIWKEGELIVAQGRKRFYWEFSNRAPSGVTGITGAATMVADETVDKISIDAIKAIDKKPNGIWSVDLTYDKNGIPNATEINIGRFFTTVLFYTEAGINFPEIYLRCSLDLPLEFKYPLVNPAERDKYWVRGMDFLPKLVPKKIFEKYKEDFQNRLK